MRSATITQFQLKHWLRAVLLPAYHQREAQLIKTT